MRLDEIIIGVLSDAPVEEKKSETPQYVDNHRTLTIMEKRKIIYRNINNLAEEDKKDILGIVLTNGYGALLRSCPEGCVIDMTTIDATTINQMYGLLDFKLNQ
jgi:hypothetical protein